MRTQDQTMTIEVKLPDGAWQRTYMDFLEPGDVIRRRHPDGTLQPYPIGNTEGKTEMVITEMPFVRVDEPKEPCSPSTATT